MHQLIDKRYKILFYLSLLIFLSTTSNKPLETKKKINIFSDRINVSGLPTNYNLEIQEKIKELSFNNVFLMNKKNIKRIISKYNLIESYSVKKIYPKSLDIKLKQTKIIAKNSNNGEVLIGSNGKVIKNFENNKRDSLPILFGEFDSMKFLEFVRYIKISNFKLKDFKSVVYHPSQRWDVITMNDILIKLPQTNLPSALSAAYRIIKDNRFKNKRTIDLRISTHIIIK